MRIMIFGTFDGLHKGHLNFFKQARKLLHTTPPSAPLLRKGGKNTGTFLIVSIARGRNVFKIKGIYPHLNEKERVALVKKSGLADKVILSGAKDHIPHIAKENPDIIALGYDQTAYVKNLRRDLKKEGIKARIVRLKPYKEKIYKNHLL